MTHYALVIPLTGLLFYLFSLRLKFLLNQRKHPDYLFMISASAFRLLFVFALYILTAAFATGLARNVLHAIHTDIKILLSIDNIMEQMMLLGMFFIMPCSLVAPFFFIQQIEVTDTLVAINGEPVQWSLKRFNTKTERTCYIQVHTGKRKGLYMTANIKQLNQIMKKNIEVDTASMPAERREKRLMDILDFRKKDAKFHFLSKNLIVAVVMACFMMFLSLIDLG
ncbi:hypothetical protein B0C58_003612 [Salmonella enterica subsp. enterica serovar Oranienburg]|nr:hypothetical protein [Salmonella enterica subsp. enterica serovar Oranienburg]